jgi:prepilin-type N-terminal cleavage/methylation domain-containing protein
MRRDGFTLIEMMVTVLIFGIVGVYVGKILTVNERAYHNVEETSEAQQNLRILTEQVEDAIRHAGMMTPRETAACGVDSNAAPDVLFLSDASAIDPQSDFEPYPGAVIAAGTITVGVVTTLQLDSLVLEPAPPNRPAYDTNGDGALDSDFRNGAGVIVADVGNPDRGTACGRIRVVDLLNDRISVFGVAALAAGGVNPVQLVAVPANEVRVQGDQLLWNGDPLARGIEDVQVAWYFDLDGDNETDPGDRRGTNGGTAYASSEYSAADLREVEVAMVARARLPDPDFVGRPQALLNRNGAAFADDNFRRRTIETRVRLRNLVARYE